ncbi:MAG: dihydrodipicolinate synthase family protein, partial [Planctomycetota bacterium]
MMLRGLISAAFTPMTSRGTVNLKAIDRLAELLVDNAVNGVFVNGTTGEFPSLTIEERLSVGRRWAKAAAGSNLKVIVHVGHTCLKAAKELARDAQRAGADAIAAVAPYYFKPTDLDGLIEFLAPIASSASKVPFYYYHIPELTGAVFPMVNFLAEGKKRIGSLAGVKFTSEDMTDFGRCVDAHGKKFNLLLARDDLLLAGLKIGGHGFVGASCNFTAQLYLKIIRNFKSGEIGLAQNLQVHGVEMLAVLRRYGLIPAAKAVMASVGCD